MEIAAWLRNLGLERYELAFRDHEVDCEVLPELTEGACAEVVERWGGYVAKHLGDGVLAYFGWPQAHEDDAERGVRAGLELAAATEDLKSEDDASLAGRIGIATGLVMVGEGAAKKQTVVGDKANLVARLQALVLFDALPEATAV